MAEFYEPAFGLDKFRKPLVYEDWEAIVKAILIVLYGKPGFYPSIPELGMNIQSYTYENFDDLDTDVIKGQLAYQLNILSDYINSDSLEVKKTTFVGEEIPGLIFTLSISKGENLAIGVTCDQSMRYNYDIITDEMVSKL